MNVKTLLLVFALTVGATVCRAATDYYVAVDGSDDHSGLSASEAKATIAAAYTAMTNGTPEETTGNRLIVGAGEWLSADIGKTLVLSNGWSLIGQNGRESTVFIASDADFKFFSLASADSSVRGITFDFNRANGIKYKNSEAVYNPKGTIADCEFRNFYSTCTWGSSGMIRIGFDSIKCSPVITNCIFRNNQNCYNGASCIRTDVNAKNFLVANCSFIDNVSGTENSSAAGTLHFYRAQGTVRNCLFLRSRVYGSSGNASVVSAGTASANMTVENCSFINCTISGFAAAGVLGLAGTVNGGYTAEVYAKNCLAWGNTNMTAGAYVGFVTNTMTRASISFSNCASESETEGDGNVVLSKLNTTWQCAPEDRWIPSSGPSVNAGVLLDWMENATDARGKCRVVDNGPDIGCYEYQGAPNVYYVAKDGDDANSGLSRRQAKATLAAGYALLSGEDESLIVGDGEWSLAETMMLTNGWSLVGENGREKVTIKPASRITLLRMVSAGVAVKGVTFDFSRIDYNGHGTAALVHNPCGRFENCTVRNYCTRSGATSNNSIVRSTSSKATCAFIHCDFEDSNVHYRTALFWIDTGKADFYNCKFIDCQTEFSGGNKYFNYGVVYCSDTDSVLRNCLFLRCRVYDTGSDTMGHSHVVSLAKNSGTLVENCSFIKCGVVGGGPGGAIGIRQTTGTGNGLVRNTYAYGCTNSFGVANLMAGLHYQNCASDTELAGENNILLADGSLKFRRPARDDYTVVSGPTVNAGTELDWMTDATDLLGRRRVVGSAPDIGCYEFDPREIPGTHVILR